MISMPLHQAAECVDGIHHGDDPVFSGCSTDSRNLQPGELFIALKGEHFDGHAFIEQAMDSGASAAMVEDLPKQSLPTIVVDDCRRAMLALAGCWRERFDIPLVAITGSNGKTTVKELVTSILSVQGPVLSTRGNLNNDIGMPLTLFGLGDEHQWAVIEMGANHPGEIDVLTKTAVPDVAVITQCAPAHLEGFGSVAGVAAAKAEIYHGVKSDGVAIINQDDDFADDWREKTRHLHQMTFGLMSSADVSARELQLNETTGCYSFELVTPQGDIDVQLALPGKHNLLNALAAAACAIALDCSLKIVKQGLEGFTGVPGRLQIKGGRAGCRVLDDTYNANPASLQAGIDVLTTLNGRHWLILGDMGELGTDSHNLHREMGEQARIAGIERLYAIGPLSADAVQGFGEGARHFTDKEALIRVVQAEAGAGIAILVKGSRAMHMEQVVAALDGEEN